MSENARLFPMMDGPPIPWALAEAIHTHLYRHDQSLERMAQRGGFGWREVAYMWGKKPPRDLRTTDKHRAACRETISREFGSMSRLSDGEK